MFLSKIFSFSFILNLSFFSTSTTNFVIESISSRVVFGAFAPGNPRGPGGPLELLLELLLEFKDIEN